MAVGTELKRATRRHMTKQPNRGSPEACGAKGASGPEKMSEARES